MSVTEIAFHIAKFIDSKKDDILSFVCGDALVMILSFHLSFVDASIKLFGVFLVGVVGGLGGLIIKDLYPLAIELIRRQIEKYKARKK